MNKLWLLLGLCTLFVLCAVLPLGSHLTSTIAADPFWGFSLDNLDRTCKPCDNFYQFAMGVGSKTILSLRSIHHGAHLPNFVTIT